MKNTCVFFILIVLLTSGCVKSTKKAEHRNLHIKDSLKVLYLKDSLHNDIIEKERQQIQDSILKEEKIVVSDIYFGITRSEYKIKESRFLKSLYNNETKNPQIGFFRFKLIPCFTEDDSLFSLCLRGLSDGYHPMEYQSLVSVFSTKYSEPYKHNGVPDWNETNPEVVWRYENYDDKLCGRFPVGAKYKICDVWVIGNKRIEIRYYYTGTYDSYTVSNNVEIIPNSYEYGWLRQLVVVIYHKKMLEKQEQKKRTELEKSLEEIERKEKEEIEKAVKVL